MITEHEANMIAARTVEMLLPRIRAIDGGLFNRKEAAAYLKMSLRAFHQAVADGKISKAREQRPAVFDKNALDVYKFLGGVDCAEPRKRKKRTAP